MLIYFDMDTCIHVHMHTCTYAHTLNSITHTLMHQTLLKANALRATTSELYIICEQVLFVYVSTVIPPRLTDPRNFITVLLVTREPEQTTLLF